MITLPVESNERKNIPLARGCLDYFPAALAEVAKLSLISNEKHNPGEELHHARNKSSDHADCILRHMVDRGYIDPEDNIRHSTKIAWRALALLQEELEQAGLAPLARGAKTTNLSSITTDSGWVWDNSQWKRTIICFGSTTESHTEYIYAEDDIWVFHDTKYKKLESAMAYAAHEFKDFLDKHKNRAKE